jgi:hypothetical protein
LGVVVSTGEVDALPRVSESAADDPGRREEDGDFPDFVRRTLEGFVPEARASLIPRDAEAREYFEGGKIMGTSSSSYGLSSASIISVEYIVVFGDGVAAGSAIEDRFVIGEF